MSTFHAVLSPSSSHRWSKCYASIRAAYGRPEKRDFDLVRDGGTCGHQILAELLVDPERDPQAYLGRTMVFWKNDITGEIGEHFLEDFWQREDSLMLRVRGEVKVDQDLIDKVMVACNFIRNVYAMKGGMMEVEQRVPIDHITAEEGASGTSDVILIGEGWIHVIDLKLGFNKVFAYDTVEHAGRDPITGQETPAVLRMNLQGGMYASGSRRKYAALGPFKTITFTIVQPHLNHVSEYTCSGEELDALEAFLRDAANQTRSENPRFEPSVKNCEYCRAAGDCRAQDAFVIEQALDGFADVETAKPKSVDDLSLGTKYALIPLVQDWCGAIAERVKEKLLLGEPVTRSDGLSYKFVAGKKGDREWVDKTEAEAALKRMRLKPDQIYKKTLQTPTQIEKLTKPSKVKKGEQPIDAVLGKTQWNRLQQLIRQSEGQPAIALETDPRPALAPRTDGFGDVAPEDNSDLF